MKCWFLHNFDEVERFPSDQPENFGFLNLSMPLVPGNTNNLLFKGEVCRYIESRLYQFATPVRKMQVFGDLQIFQEMILAIFQVTLISIVNNKINTSWPNLHQC